MCENILDAASFAKNELAWLTALHVSLKSHQLPIQERAASMITWPEDYKAMINSPGFHHAVRHAKVRPDDPPGHYLNKAVVVYAVSMLEHFLKGLYKEACGSQPDDRASLGEICQSIVQSLPSLKEAKETKAVHYFILLRNLIVHERGIVGEKFQQEAGPLAFAAFGWNEAWFRETNPIDKKVNLDYIAVVLANMAMAMDFIDKAVDALKEE
jgi:hypothetical protein